jgi:hypothetical protein
MWRNILRGFLPLFAVVMLTMGLAACGEETDDPGTTTASCAVDCSGTDDEGDPNLILAAITSKNWPAADIQADSSRSNCEACAREIQKLIGGNIVIIKPTPPDRLLGAYRGKNWGWYEHHVVVLNGRVYDNFTGGAGETISVYKSRWQYASVINFGF